MQNRDREISVLCSPDIHRDKLRQDFPEGTPLGEPVFVGLLAMCFLGIVRDGRDRPLHFQGNFECINNENAYLFYPKCKTESLGLCFFVAETGLEPVTFGL